MFTGIVEGLGSVVRLVRRGGAIRLEVKAPGAVADLRPGSSIAVNGSCVTVTDLEGTNFAVDLVPETLGRTNLGTLQPGEEVNLERPVLAGARLDGHIVQGHVDVVGLVRSRRRAGAQELLEINIPFELTRYIASKGSIAVEGVSLTVVDVNKDRFRVALIPHTLATTTLGKKVQGQAVNVEVDVLSKYVERHIAARMPQRPPSIATLVAAQDAEHRAATAAANVQPVVTAPAAPAFVTPAAPRSQPAPRPVPPPRQQPPRYTADPPKAAKFSALKTTKPEARKATALKTTKPEALKTTKPEARKATARTAKPKAKAPAVSATSKTHQKAPTRARSASRVRTPAPTVRKRPEAPKRKR